MAFVAGQAASGKLASTGAIVAVTKALSAKLAAPLGQPWPNWQLEPLEEPSWVAR